MNAFRYYTVQVGQPAGERSWTFAESEGVLTLVNEAPELPTLAQTHLHDEDSGATIELTVHGDPYARRMLPTSEDPLLRLTRLFLAQARIRAGLMLAGLYKMRFFRYAGELEVAITAEALTEDERMNLLAEALLGSWCDLSAQSRPRLLAIAGLDPRISEPDLRKALVAWYARATRWSTRVVGFKFRAHRFVREEKGREVAKINVGDPCLLVREHHNKVDPNAVMVLHKTGEKLGYLRCDIAALVAPLIDHGTVLGAHVGAFLSAERNPDERLYLVIERASLPAAMAS